MEPKEIKDLKKYYKKFTQEREWDKYHTPKDLSIAISIESSELQELFLWKSNEEIKDLLNKDSNFSEKVNEELIDIFAYLVRLSDILNVDLIDTFYKKMKKNEKKYPIDKIKGNFKKYNQIDD